MLHTIYLNLRHSKAKQKFVEKTKDIMLLIYNLFNTESRIPIVVASTGRNGSTLLFKSLVNSRATNRLERFIFAQSRWRLGTSQELRFNGIYKTHDLPTIVKGVKYIFIYGDPLDSALSVFHRTLKDGNSWLKLHCSNLGYSGEVDLSLIFEEDMLNYEKQMSTWTSLSNPNCFTLDIMDLWDDRKSLELFLQVTLNLPPKRARAVAEESHLSNTMVSLRNIYQSVQKEKNYITRIV